MMSRNKKSAVQKDIHNAYQQAAPYLSIAYALFGGMLFFGLVGYYIDEKSGTTPLFLIMGIFLGMGLGFYRMIKTIQNMERQ